MGAKKKELDRLKEFFQPVFEDDLNKGSFEEITAAQIQLEIYKNCSLCGSELFFVQVTDYASNTVKEESHCPNCNIKEKQKEHPLQ